MLHPRLNCVERLLQRGSLCIRLCRDQICDVCDLLRVAAAQILERFVFGHVNASCGFNVTTLRQNLARTEQNLSNVFAVLGGRLGSQRVEYDFGVCDLGKRAGQVFTHPFALHWRPALFFGGIDLAGLGRVMHLAAIYPPRCLQPHAVGLGLFDHRQPEVVIVEPMIARQIEKLALLRAAIQYEMRMRMLAVLMYSNDIIKVAFIFLEEPLGHVSRDVAHVLSARSNREGHQQMCGLPKFGFEPRVPPLGKALGQVFDLAALKLGFAIQEPAAVDDMGGLCREVFELVGQLGFIMRAPAPDRFEHSGPMSRSGAHHLLLLGGIQTLHRATDPAPPILKYLSGDGTNRIIQPHGRTPSRQPLLSAASRHAGGAQAGQSHLHYRG